MAMNGGRTAFVKCAAWTAVSAAFARAFAWLNGLSTGFASAALRPAERLIPPSRRERFRGFGYLLHPRLHAFEGGIEEFRVAIAHRLLFIRGELMLGDLLVGHVAPSYFHASIARISSGRISRIGR